MDDKPPTLRRKSVPVVAEEPAVRSGLPEPELAYDYFKSMASVGFATLGGILTLGGTVFGTRIVPWQMGLSALLVMISAILALQAKTDIMQACQGIKPPFDSARLAARLVPGLYGMGVGVFLMFLALSYFGG